MNCPYCGVAFNMWVKNHPECEEKFSNHFIYVTNYIQEKILSGSFKISNLSKEFIEAEKFLIRAVQLMPDDPIVNDHYGDILWKLDRKIQARYFWPMVLNMKDVEDKLIDQIQNKLIYGLKSS